MSSTWKGSYLCPRLLDYLVIVGARHPSRNNEVAQTPELLRRYPAEDHRDFRLPPDVIFFCQPEGCLTVGQKRNSLRDNTSFVFTLTDKDSGRMRYGICLNFYRPFRTSERKSAGGKREKMLANNRQNSSSSNDTLSLPLSDDQELKRSPRTKRRIKQSKKVRNNSLTSLCILSHHPFVSTFRECLFILKRLIDACHDRSTSRKHGGKSNLRDSIWGVLTGICNEIPAMVRHDIREIETWILRLLSAPVPVPGKTRVELDVLPNNLQSPLTFALPDHTRFSLVDYPLHLPLELLGVETCLKVLTLIILENKVILQSRDYNALSMSVLAFVNMIYPMEYMFPVIPLLPTCMGSAEQLLLAPTPFVIGIPASFLLYKNNFGLPDDVWLIDLDSNRIVPPTDDNILPDLPEPEGSTLRAHLKQIVSTVQTENGALQSMNMSPSPTGENSDDFLDNINSSALIFGTDVASVDVATRVAIVKFFMSPNVIANHNEHTRTLRLHPRPVVAFQVKNFLESRPKKTEFIDKLARTQAIEYFGESCLKPVNVTYLRIQTGVYDPAIIGDKSSWYSHQLIANFFRVYSENSSLATAIQGMMAADSDSSNPTDESGEDSDGGSTSSSYSSLNDFVTDMKNSDIRGDAPEHQDVLQSEVNQLEVYHAPDSLQVPSESQASDSACSVPDSDSSSSQEAPPYDSSDDEADGEDEEEINWRPKRPVEIIEPTGNDTDADIDSLKYDSDNNSASTVKSRTGIEVINEQPGQVDEDNNKIQVPTEGSVKRATLRQQGKSHSVDVGRNAHEPTSPSVLEKMTALFRSESSDSSNPPSPVKSKKSSLFQGIMDFAMDSERDRPNSPASSNGADLTYTPSVTSDPGPYRSSSGVSSMSTGLGIPTRKKKTTSSPFPTNTRKSLVERSPLIKHSSTKKPNEKEKKKLNTANDERPNSDSQLFLKEITRGVLEGNNVGWFNFSRLKKLMQNENLRAQVISQLYPQENTVTEDFIEDTKVTKPVYKGVVSVLKAIIAGLEHSYDVHAAGGVASAFALLEIAHTHYFGKEPVKVSKVKDTKHAGIVDGSDRDKSWYGYSGGYRKRLGGGAINTHSLNEDNFIAAIESWQRGRTPSNQTENLEAVGREDSGNNSSYEMIDEGEASIGSTTGAGVFGAVGIAAGIAVTGAMGSKIDITPLTGNPKENAGDTVATTEDGVAEQPPKSRRKRSLSMDSEGSENSTLVSNTSSETMGNDDSDLSYNDGDGRSHNRSRINHQSIRPVSDSEIELNRDVSLAVNRPNPISTLTAKSCFSAGFRYHKNKMISTDSDNTEGILRHYVFEALIGKDRSALWDHLEFWEDAYLDAVAAERDAVGMDQGPAEMIHRYESLGQTDKKRLEEDEDKLLSDTLYNMIAFMVMLKVPKPDVKKKVRRLLGKSHIGLKHSAAVNNLLDHINNLHGNDIDLKPSGSRQMRKHSFVVHAGSDNKGDVLFMEVCDDCVIIRSGNGAICDRCWYERLINMTFCPKTKVLCLGRQVHGETRLDKFYTKKCKELYNCIKESMEKAASKLKNGMSGEPELGGEFPIQDLKTGEGGLLHVTMEGIGLKFSHSKDKEAFIELKDIKEYKTKNDVFILHEFDSSNKNLIKRRFRSSMASDIGYAMLCVFSYVAAAKSGDGTNRKEHEAKMAITRLEYMKSP
ncbi:MAP kinase-activating death domain protein-like isoform X4 [Anneissia japonica]|uniref:MAP kinase-activating death domain protein-like isoform X4 n=1 Tax=Anneissia japonica TaxID=1529436 RepID=UPI001425B9FB|nr:MAP kinase-activating death domain protein-like isoform X4 [Anneissia japonica]